MNVPDALHIERRKRPLLWVQGIVGTRHGLDDVAGLRILDFRSRTEFGRNRFRIAPTRESRRSRSLQKMGAAGWSPRPHASPSSPRWFRHRARNLTMTDPATELRHGSRAVWRRRRREKRCGACVRDRAALPDCASRDRFPAEQSLTPSDAMLRGPPDFGLSLSKGGTGHECQAGLRKSGQSSRIHVCRIGLILRRA